MLSKVPPRPVLELNYSSTSKEDSSHSEEEEQATTSVDGLVNEPTVNEQPQLNPPDADRNSEEEQPCRELPPRARGSQSPHQQQQTRVQRPTDDRIFTLAAVGLVLAIMFLLLKKFIKSSSHGAVFMDGS